MLSQQEQTKSTCEIFLSYPLTLHNSLEASFNLQGTYLWFKAQLKQSLKQSLKQVQTCLCKNMVCIHECVVVGSNKEHLGIYLPSLEWRTKDYIVTNYRGVTQFVNRAMVNASRLKLTVSHLGAQRVMRQLVDNSLAQMCSTGRSLG